MIQTHKKLGGDIGAEREARGVRDGFKFFIRMQMHGARGHANDTIKKNDFVLLEDSV